MNRSASPPGGNQVDGSPPALRVRDRIEMGRAFSDRASFALSIGIVNFVGGRHLGLEPRPFAFFDVTNIFKK